MTLTKHAEESKAKVAVELFRTLIPSSVLFSKKQHSISLPLGPLLAPLFLK
jgi:hypothetical protein